MRPIFIIVFLFFAVPVIAQKDTAVKIELTMPDTAFMNKQIHRLDSINNARSISNMNNNMVSFLSQMQEEKNRKAKQQMWIRLGFAAILLIIGIIGFVRRKKKAAGTK